MSSESDYTNFNAMITGKDDAKNFINTKVLAANTIISNAQAMLDESIADTQDEINAPVEDYVDGIPEYDVAPAEFNKETIRAEPAPETPDIRNALSLNLGVAPMVIEDWDVDNVVDLPSSPELKDGQIDSLNNVDKPPAFNETAPVGKISFVPADYVSGLRDFIEGEIKSALSATDDIEILKTTNVALDGNTGNISPLSAAFEQALYDSARQRLRNEEVIALDETNTVVAARGFPLPPGVLSSMQAGIRGKYADEMVKLNNDVIVQMQDAELKRSGLELQKAGQITDAQAKHDTILIQLTELEVSYLQAIAANKAVYIESASKLEDVSGKIFMEQQRLSFEAEEKSVLVEVQVYSTKAEVYKQLMEAYVSESNVLIARVSAETDYNKSLADVFSSEIQAALASVNIEKIKLDGKQVLADIEAKRVASEIDVLNAENARLIAIVNEYAAEVSAYSSKIDALKVMETLDLERFSIESTAKSNEISTLVQQAVAEMDIAMKQITLRIEALKSQATISASIVSAALNSMSTNTSFGFDGSNKISSTSTRIARQSLAFTYGGSAPEYTGNVTP